MKNPYLFFLSLLIVGWGSSCQRPYALVQRTPSPRYLSPVTPLARAVPDTIPTQPPTVSAPAQPAETFAPPLVADTRSQLALPIERPLAQRRLRMEHLLQTPEAGLTEITQPRPKPKPKTQLRLGNRIRESLGLPLREELTWWQRIDWKLKASVLVILVALIFALAGISQLALVFGLVGALLLVLGLKRSFKKRRPWF